MKIYRGNEEAPGERGSFITIGFFDGVHLGHQAVLQELKAWARGENAPAGVLTFGRHPKKVLGERAPELLTSLDHRLRLFERADMDFTWVLDFTLEMSRLDAEAFARRFLLERLAIRGLVLGFDSRFGCDRMGTGHAGLEAMAQRAGFSVRCLKPVHNAEGAPVSSTRVREAIWDGRLRDAEAMLGRRVSVLGRIVRGDARGRRLGYATANLDLDREVRPPFGVYATLAEVDEKKHPSITNVGYRPTVTRPLPAGEKPDLMIETHLLDFEGELYGKIMEVHFIEKIRNERRFPDVRALAKQIKKDEAKARGILRALNF